jgi:DMSO/TMAO reductase YedYZ heme-binding membrane subunit
LPRFFEVGPSPLESFIKMITTFDSLGVILGIVLWILIFVLGATSLFRDKLNMSYKNWKLLHSLLSVAFIILATWHTTNSYILNTFTKELRFYNK